MRRVGHVVLALVGGMLLSACASVPTPQSRPSYIYVVERGDSVSKIAGRLGIETQDLVRQNGLRAPYTIHPGQRLRLPPGNRYSSAARPARLATPRQATPHQATPAPRAPQVQSAPVQAAPPAYPAQPSSAPAATPSYRPLMAQGRESGAPALAWPADSPVLGQFGSPRDGRPSNGMTLSLLPGQRILAASAGTVLFAGLEPMFGQLVIVDHGGGWVTAYGFVGQITVKEGDLVKYRERIGVNGTKNRTLHFELRRDNSPRDPMPYLPARF